MARALQQKGPKSGPQLHKSRGVRSDQEGLHRKRHHTHESKVSTVEMKGAAVVGKVFSHRFLSAPTFSEEEDEGSDIKEEWLGQAKRHKHTGSEAFGPYRLWSAGMVRHVLEHKQRRGGKGGREKTRGRRTKWGTAHVRGANRDHEGNKKKPEEDEGGAPAR